MTNQEQDSQAHHSFDAMKVPEFRSLATGRFFFTMALRMMTTLLGWWIYNLTNAPFAIGLIGLSEVVPAVSLALYAGHIIDLSDKQKLLRRGISLYFLSAIILLLLSTKNTATVLSNETIAICIYFIVFCTGIVRAFTGPVFSVILAQVVPRNLLQNATTWNQGAYLSASVTGHAVGGLLIAFLGNTGTFAVIAVLITAAFIVLLKIKPKPPLEGHKEKRTWDSVKEGLHFVYKTKEILGAMSLDLFAVLFGGAVAMVPVFARDILQVGSEGFGILNGASDMGAICSVILLTISPLRKQQGHKLLLAVGGFGLCIICFALSKLFLLSFLALMISGMLDGISVVIRGTIMQLKTPDAMRGRVMSVNSMFINSSNEFGQFESGLAAKLMGVVPSVIFGGCMTVAVVIITWFKAPSLRKMEY